MINSSAINYNPAQNSLQEKMTELTRTEERTDQINTQFMTNDLTLAIKQLIEITRGGIPAILKYSEFDKYRVEIEEIKSSVSKA